MHSDQISNLKEGEKIKTTAIISVRCVYLSNRPYIKIPEGAELEKVSSRVGLVRGPTFRYQGTLIQIEPRDFKNLTLA